ncbi:serine/threonine-protein kinase [Mycolicibacterium mucogenicum]|uniref:serine/threonine-protein kinase n=1 Tax=Mycolicibacterium mucogenicum TaxID=56689 RepID=UPI0022697E1C|nr:serine/threonine-protein kinase [Mycolicibacterium mucogenicum]MCX8562188.1 serine/threonine-protein kinase [Mycolicibacterium mucogenicum]
MPMAEGTDFAGYTIVRCLGSGGMGEVYVAQHPRLPRQDALKVLRPEMSTNQEFRERFLREADLTAALSHPNIVGVYDRGEFDGQLWISMEYVDGIDVSRLLRGAGGVTDDQAVVIISAVADALDYAHQHDLLHRDVKPANILISDTDPASRRIKLADFGIARCANDSAGLTATNMTVGTVFYAAPEQLTGSLIDGRADQYALAATAFQLFTGAPPFENSNAAVIIGKHLSAAPPLLSERRPDLAALDPVLAKALAKDPKDRFDKCADFARALQHGLGGTGVDATILAPAVPGRTRVLQPDKATRTRRSLIMPVVLTVLLMATLVFAAIEFTRAKDEQPAAPRPAATTTTAPPSSASVVAPTEPSAAPTEATVTSTVTVETTTPPATTPTNPTTTETPAPEQETPIRECMDRTGMTRLQCWEEIRRSERRR